MRTGAQYLFFRDNPKGRAPRALAPRVRLRAVVQRRPPHGDARGTRGVRDDRGRAGRGLGGTVGSARLAAPAGSYLDRTRAVSFTFNGRTLTGLCRRHARLRAARQRRAPRRAQLQAAPAARHLVLRRGGAERAGGRGRGCAPHAERARDAAADRRGPERGERQLLAGCGAGPGRTHRRLRRTAAGGLLLQDLQVAELAAVRACHPPHGGPGAGAARAPTPITTRKSPWRPTCSWSAAGIAGLTAAVAGAEGGARHDTARGRPTPRRDAGLAGRSGPGDAGAPRARAAAYASSRAPSLSASTTTISCAPARA